MKNMTIYVSTTDNLASFGDIFFSEDEADAMVEFAVKLGYNAVKENTAQRFSEENLPFRKIMVRDIDWSDYNNILYIIDNRDKTDEQIVKALNSEGSGFSITIKRGQVMTEYSNYLEKVTGTVMTREMKIEVAKQIAGKFVSGKSGIMSDIDRMLKRGCTVCQQTGFPECVKGFNSSCFSCPHNKSAGSLIKTDADIAKCNIMLKDLLRELIKTKGER